MVEACDIIRVNSYPMEAAGWFTFGAFEESRRFLLDPGVRKRRLTKSEARFRLLLDQLKKAGKPLLFTETGYPLQSVIAEKVRDWSFPSAPTFDTQRPCRNSWPSSAGWMMNTTTRSAGCISVNGATTYFTIKYGMLKAARSM